MKCPNCRTRLRPHLTHFFPETDNIPGHYLCERRPTPHLFRLTSRLLKSLPPLSWGWLLYPLTLLSLISYWVFFWHLLVHIQAWALVQPWWPAGSPGFTYFFYTVGSYFTFRLCLLLLKLRK